MRWDADYSPFKNIVLLTHYLPFSGATDKDAVELEICEMTSSFTSSNWKIALL